MKEYIINETLTRMEGRLEIALKHVAEGSDPEKAEGWKRAAEHYACAAECLKEIQQYRSIGTVEECREAMEKQKAKEPYIWGTGIDSEGNIIYDMYDCPNCGKSYNIVYNDCDYCPECGQAIDRSGIPE